MLRYLLLSVGNVAADVTCEIVLRQKMNPPGGAALTPEPVCVKPGTRAPVYEFSPSLPKAFVASRGGVRQLGGKFVTIVGGNASAEKSVPTVFIPASATVVADGPASGVQSLSAAATGTKKVLVARMRSTTHGQEPTPTIDDLKERVFGMGISPVAVNFKSQSAACSENDLIIEPGACVSGNTAPGCAEISDGVMNLDLDMDLSPGVDYNAVQTAAFAKLNALGLRDAATADYVMFLFPPGISPYIAYAYINWWASFYSDTWGGSVSAHMHEVGHNFGLAHSGELGAEYGDQSSYMGYSYSSIGSPAMCYHGGQHRSLGWYSTHTTEIAASDFVSGQNELVNLFAFTDVQALSAGDPVIIKLDVANEGYALYLQYNKAEAHNSGVVESANLVTVVQDALNTPAYQQSWKVASLGEGASYDDNLRVKVCSLDVVGSVDVVRLSISLDYIGDPCFPPMAGRWSFTADINLVTNHWGSPLNKWNMCCGAGHYCQTCYAQSCCTGDPNCCQMETYDEVCCGEASGSCYWGSCKACPAGTYSPPGGFYQRGVSGSTCPPCPAGTTSEEGATNCSPLLPPSPPPLPPPPSPPPPLSLSKPRTSAGSTAFASKVHTRPPRCLHTRPIPGVSHSPRLVLVVLGQGD